MHSVCNSDRPSMEYNSILDEQTTVLMLHQKKLLGISGKWLNTSRKNRKQNAKTKTRFINNKNVKACMSVTTCKGQ